MCCVRLVSYLPNKINIFDRVLPLSKTDVLFTYTFLISCTTMVSIYSSRYYGTVKDDIHNCREKGNSLTECINEEFFHAIVPYVGILFGFITTLYRFHNCLIFSGNCICCLFCCNNNVPDSDISFEMNDVVIRT